MWRDHYQGGWWSEQACNYTVPCPTRTRSCIQFSVQKWWQCQSVQASLQHRLCCHVVWQNILFSKDNKNTVFLGLTAGFSILYIKHFSLNKQHSCCLCVHLCTMHTYNLLKFQLFLVPFFHNQLNTSNISVFTSGKFMHQRLHSER